MKNMSRIVRNLGPAMPGGCNAMDLRRLLIWGVEYPGGVRYVKATRSPKSHSGGCLAAIFRAPVLTT
jgi:hypothetical protein